MQNEKIEADIVVAGAGHNSLITAAYLAKAGKKVVVVYARPRPGGGVDTEELIPDFWVDSCSTGHTLLRSNPVLAKDTLGLVAKTGLKYIDPDPVARVAFPDGEQISMFLDLNKTLEEFSRFSKKDAQAYERLLGEYNDVKSIFSQSNNSPIGWAKPLDQLLEAAPLGNVWKRRRALSAWEVINHEFEEEHIKAYLFWQASQTFASLDMPGTGLLAISIVAGRQANSWSIPVGGSGKLSQALVEVIQDNGGEFYNKQVVTKLIIEAGKCIGIETASNNKFFAKDAVVSTIHIKHLIEMADEKVWEPGFVYGAKTYDVGTPGFAIYMATDVAPIFKGATPEQTAVSSGLMPWPKDALNMLRAIRDRLPIESAPHTLIATPTLVDPSRAPAGKHTIKVLFPCSFTPPYGKATWDDAKDEHEKKMMDYVRTAIPNLTEDKIIAKLVKSPTDFEKGNRHMIDGCWHGGDRSHAFSGPMRPAPGWAAHKTPLAGLYQTGGTTHPGGSITGVPGRNAAMVVMKDLGLDFPG